MSPHTTGYQILGYIPNIITALVVLVIWGAQTLTRLKSGKDELI